MPPIEEVTEIPGIPGTLSGFESRAQTVDPTLSPEDPGSLRSLAKDALAHLKELIDGHNRQVTHEIELSRIEQLKVEADAGFYSAKEALARLNQSFYERGQVDTVQGLAVLLGYASGYHLYTQLCSEGSPVDVVERWNAVNQGNQVNCPQLVTSQNDFNLLVSMTLSPHTVTGDTTRSFFETLQDRGFLRFGPQFFYQQNGERFYGGVGIYGEGVVSLKEDSPWFAGTLLQANLQNSYDGQRDSPFKGKLKTTEWSIMPPLLEFGYLASPWGILLLAGGWFTTPLVDESERENVPYKDSLFKNPNFLGGIKGTSLRHRVGLGVNYSYTPWGFQYAVTLDSDLNFWKSK